MTIKKLEKLGVEVVVFDKVKEKPVSFRVLCDKYLSMYTGLSYKTLKAMASVTLESKNNTIYGKIQKTVKCSQTLS
jgi:hypothetical protein